MTWPVTLQLDERAYSLSVAQRTAYSVANDFAVEVQSQEHRITLVVMPNSASVTAESLPSDHVRALILQQLNDFALRERVQQETAGIRETLILTAFAGCSR
ncbi:His-Xaa-Ser system protein HxsD [compost metagenome]